ncbi:PREDICTED: protein enabled homolog [Nelumbo nucifera]|uniref:Protein enabled homolog n=1 Tax=Nelumbo nucifera TaxID=4432 RepID=A0A1U8AME9_NELNU|nr:PREDICTED: protein enabled homolog [Nelumbo nucifera]
MDSQRSAPLGLSWSYFLQGKTMEELKHSLLYTTLELETTRLTAQEEIRKREDQVIHLKGLLCRAIRERDDARDKYQRLVVEKLLILQQQQQQHYHQPQQTTPLSGVSSIEDEARRGVDSNTGISSSDCEESIVSSPVMDSIPPPPLPPPPPTTATTTVTTIQLEPDRPLPEKGKLLQAVMKAGPLLQTLLLAGPLPQWRHPPPPLDALEIPPVTIPSPPPALLHQDSFINGIGDNSCGSIVNRRKRGIVNSEGSDSSTKYQRVLY